MRKVERRCHHRALSENVELGLIGGALASGVDCFWVIMDMHTNGIHGHYIIILTGLFFSFILLTITAVRQHRVNVKDNFKAMYNRKMGINRCIQRHNRRHP